MATSGHTCLEHTLDVQLLQGLTEAPGDPSCSSRLLPPRPRQAEVESDILGFIPGFSQPDDLGLIIALSWISHL